MDLTEFKLLSEINPEDITKVHKLNIVFKFMNIKAEQPNLTQEQICKKLGISSSTIKRIRQDLNVKSPYRYDVPLKQKSHSVNTKIQETDLSSHQKHTPLSDNAYSIPFGDKKKTKNVSERKKKNKSEKVGFGQNTSDDEVDAMLNQPLN